MKHIQVLFIEAYEINITYMNPDQAGYDDDEAKS